MSFATVAWRNWLRSSHNATTYVGVSMIVLMWIGLALNWYNGRRDFLRAAIENASNISRVWEEYVARSINEIDKSLLLLRTLYEQDPAGFDLKHWADNPYYSSDLAAVVGLVGADGYLKVSNSAAAPNRVVDLRHREHYQHFLNATTDELFITKPMVNEANGRTIIAFARPLRGVDGAFDGVAAVLVEPEQLTRFFDIIDVGKNGRITIVGTDGIVRAARGGMRNVVGQPLGTLLLDRFRESDTGDFEASGFDGYTRMIVYRKVKGFPLLSNIGLPKAELLAKFWTRQGPSGVIAGVITLIILLGIGFNVRHRLRLDAAQAALRASEASALEKSRELEITLEHMSQGLMMIAPDRTVAVINHQALNLLGLPEDFLAGNRKFDDVLAFLWAQGDFGEDGETLDPALRDFIKRGGLDDIGTYERTRPNGTVLEVHSVPLPGGGLVRTLTDISERKHSEARIAHMARHDELTGLANRSLLRERVEQALARSRRSGERCAVLLLDLDRFKDVNDTLGHAAGDSLLQTVAQRLCCCVRDVDTVARLGGDEFAIVQTAIHGVDDVIRLGRRILKAVGETYDIGGHAVEIGTSIGVAMVPEDGGAVETLLRKADLALYRVKSEGRGDWRFFEASMEAQLQARHALESDMRRALHGRAFELDYQPMFDLASREVIGVEALLRWNHPRRGWVSPAEFIPVAEEAGLISELGEWATHKACGDAMLWPPEISVSVNVSPSQFRSHRLIDVVRKALAVSGLPASPLVLEITETVLLHETQANLAELRELRELGVGIALDDFGTGYSSLSYLRSFPFTKIKIDKSFVHGLSHDRPDCAAIVRAVADLGATLGVPTVAEGVETKEQLDQVRAAGCQEVQGFLLSKPLPAEEIAAVIARHKRGLVRAA